MDNLAAQGANPPSSGWFLLLWCAIAIVMGGRFATAAGAAHFRDVISRRRYSIPPPVRVIRALGGTFAFAGVVLIPVAIWLITR